MCDREILRKGVIQTQILRNGVRQIEPEDRDRDRSKDCDRE